MIIKIKKGCLYGLLESIDKKYLDNIPDDYKINQQNRDNNKYHITIIQSNELKNIDYIENEVNIKYFNLGLSKLQKDKNEVYYLYIYSNDLNDIRKKFNLEEKTFHITVGFKFNDIHDKDKSLNNIFIKNTNLTDNEIIPCINNDEINNYLKENYYFPKILIKELKKNYVKYQQNITILIENHNYLGYIFKYQISNNIEDLKSAIDNYDHKIQIIYDPSNIGILNSIKKINNEIMKNKLEFRQKLYYYCDKSNKVILHDMPRNFSWIIEGKIGGISKVKNEIDIIILQSLGIKKIYYFLEKRYFDNIDTKDIQIKYVHCINATHPTIDDMLDTLQNEDFNEPVLFGCLGGYGRTGTALACYLCHNSYFSNNIDSSIDNNMNSERAITFLRSIRPKSIENDIQLDFVKQYYNHLFKLDSNYQSSKIKTPIKFIMLVGLPGAGKTTFTELFMTNGMNIKIVNQDMMGRSVCEGALLKFIKDSDITILDRVNSTKKDRKDWIENASLSPKNCLCIYLSTPKFICLDRAKARTNHPTIKKGGGQRIITDIDNKFEVPSKDEGFSDIIILEDEEDVRDYLKTWKCAKIEMEDKDTEFIHKFPRTRHIFNVGGATVDDRILDADDCDTFMKEDDVFIAEKVDGAQLGISIDENYKIMVQNRSHYVNSKSHSQFEKLDKWIFDHKESLYQILNQDTILFGEWLYAKHSIDYNNLPDYFMAFDLYNKKKKLFYNRDKLVEALKDTNLHYVREMYRGKIKDKTHLLKMIEQKSDYTDGRVEGIYLKIFENDYVKSRCKLVRNDFICGNDHWSKGIMQKNTLTITK
jgi:atypical dual specificity phosphatase